MPQISPYISIARVDHWFKNIFMLPGAAVALVLADIPLATAILPLLVGVFSACLIASANYVINEWLDAEFDKHHPKKKYRASVKSDYKRLSNVWHDIRETNISWNDKEIQTVHFTPKPLKAIERIIKVHTQENETVLDCFMGSGTTGVACRNLNRRFIGIELDEKYFRIAQERINEKLVKELKDAKD